MIDVEEKELLGNGGLCQRFKGSEMYALLDSIMAALESEALDKLSASTSNNKEELYGLTVRWQERKFMRQSIKEEIDSNISDSQALLAQIGLDPEEWQVRSMIDNG